MTPFHASLLKALEPHGLTAAHIAILDDDGYTSPSQVARLTSTELKSMLGIKGGLAADILTLAEAAKNTDFGTTQAGTQIVIQTTLENLYGADTIRTAAVEALMDLGIGLVVVGEDQELLTKETLAFLNSPDRKAAQRQKLWGDFALVPVETFLPDTSPVRSPYSTEPLVEGFDPAGTPWGELPRERLGLAVWAVQEKMDAGRPHAEIFQSFKTADELYERARRRSKAKGVKDSDLRELAKAPAQNPSKNHGSAPMDFSGKHPKVALKELLLALYDREGLTHFLDAIDFPMNSLPHGGSLSNFAFEAIEILTRHGLLRANANVFEALFQERPAMRENIRQVAGMFGFQIA